MLNDPLPQSELTCPLCVDLDGTLIKSDSLQDAFFQFLRRSPLELWRIPLWLSKGRARLKQEIAQRAPLDAARLPYNAAVRTFLQAQHRLKRPIYLATGADSALAERVARHLDLFDGVLASDGVTNLTHTSKLQTLKERFGTFDYIGNSRADLPLLAGARQAMVANPTLPLRLALRARHISIVQTFVDRRTPLRSVIKAVRVHQWAKNILLFLPLIMSHKLSLHAVGLVLAAFFCFSFIASSNYLLNDLLDIESDRRHSSKRLRPFAAGDLPATVGIALSLGLAAAAAAMLPLLNGSFGLWMVIYIATTLSYSFFLKRIAIVDVLVLSGLYTLRLLAGGAATGTEISHWLAGFSSFLFLSLAMVKRYSELENLRERGQAATHGRGYLVADMEQIRSFGTASAYAAVVVFMLYIARPDVTALYRYPSRLWLIVPLLIYWVNRVWLLAGRGELDDDPVVFAMRDRMSLAVGLAVVIVAVFAA
ncbi:MAG TPA: UbiA family prenyltransferase [Terracidiphilus sp.]|nr:UbiA family prenyltransferase [Terracidiphilus sp.]